MFLEEFKRYQSQYHQGVKKIVHETIQYPYGKDSEGRDREPKKTMQYELFFNREGRLLHSVHEHRDSKKKIIYGYNRHGLISDIMELKSMVNEVRSRTKFTYDSNRRIIKQKCLYPYSGGLIEQLHSYYENTETINLPEEEGCPVSLYLMYDDKKRIIDEQEVSGDADEFVRWTARDFDEDGNLLLESILDSDGKTTGTYEYSPKKNGLITGYIYSDKDSQYKREYKYMLNNLGFWINKIMLNDGLPRFEYNRYFEYY